MGPDSAAELALMLDYFPNADHAGIYAAQAGDHFERAGLDVKIRQPADPGRADQAGGRRAGGPGDLLRARGAARTGRGAGGDRRWPRSCASRSRRSSRCPRAGVRSPKDLEGKTVGTAGIDYQSAYLRTILLEAGVDPKTVKERDVGFGLSPALLTKRVDATLGAFWNYEGTDLELRGRNPQIIKVDDAGVPPYDELVLVANEDALERDGERIRAFIGALGRGTKDLRDGPGRRDRGAAQGQPRAGPRAAAGGRGRDAAPVPAQARQAVRVPGRAALAGVRGLDAREPAGDQDPRCRRRVHQRATCPAPGL